MKHLLYYTLFIYSIALSGCIRTATVTNGGGADTVAIPFAASSQIEHSQLLSIHEVGNYTLCQISDPWQTGQTARQYLLVPQQDEAWSEEVRDSLEQAYGPSLVLRTPLSRITLTSACHAWLLWELDALDKVSVMCDTGYVQAKALKEWMRTTGAEGHPLVADGGNAIAPNAEVIVANGSDAIWVNPIQNTGLGNLSHLPMPIIYCADYMETSPLGRAEWMKFYGRLVGRGQRADTLFARIEAQYNSAVWTSTSEPSQSLLAELPYGATWYVPGGCSTAAVLYQDAGYAYPWSDDEHAGSLSLSKEAVLARAADCDLWLFKYYDTEATLTLQSFLAQDPIYAQFRAARSGEVWGCNTATSDFFDVTPFRPDTLLQSLVSKDGAFFRRLQ